MSATAAAFLITDEEMADSTPSSYADIEVDTDYEAVLSTVEDYDKTANGGTKGWIFTYRIEGLPFKVWISHSKASRWKLIETVHAHRPGMLDERDENGQTAPIDPNEFLGETVGAHVILDGELDTPRKVIQYVFSLAEEEPTPADVPVL